MSRPSEQSSKSRSRPSRVSKSTSRQPRPVALGLDLSLTGTGLVVWDGQRVLHHRHLRTEPVPAKSQDRSSGLRPNGKYRGSEEERIDFLARAISKRVKRFQPVVVGIEGHSFASKGRALSVLHELHGVVKNRLLRFGYRQGSSLVIIAPPTLKKDATGNGRADKDEMLAVAQQVWPECSNHDLADALHVAALALDTFRNT